MQGIFCLSKILQATLFCIVSSSPSFSFPLQRALDFSNQNYSAQLTFSKREQEELQWCLDHLSAWKCRTITTPHHVKGRVGHTTDVVVVWEMLTSFVAYSICISMLCCCLAYVCAFIWCAQHWILPDNWGGNALIPLKSFCKGLWSAPILYASASQGRWISRLESKLTNNCDDSSNAFFGLMSNTTAHFPWAICKYVQANSKSTAQERTSIQWCSVQLVLRALFQLSLQWHEDPLSQSDVYNTQQIEKDTHLSYFSLSPDSMILWRSSSSVDRCSSSDFPVTKTSSM